MTDANHLNISFLRSLPEDTLNWADRFIIGLGEGDDSKDELGIEEVDAAYKKSVPPLPKFAAYNMDAALLMRSIRTYLATRYFRRDTCQGSEAASNAPCADAVWIRLALTKDTSYGSMAQFLSLVTFISPEEEITAIIPSGIFFYSESRLVQQALNAAHSLPPAGIDALLGDHRRLKVAHRNEIILKLFELRKKNPERSGLMADIILDIVEGQKKQVLGETIKAILEKKGEIFAAIQLDYNILNDAFVPVDKSTRGGEKVKYPPLDKTFGAYVAGQLPLHGIADKRAVDRMAVVLTSEGYDRGTKTMIANALGGVSYADEGVRAYAALQLYKYLNHPSVTVERIDKDGFVHRHILEAIKSLGRLGYAKMGDKDILKMIAYHLFDMAHPEARITAVRAFGLIGVSPRISDGERMKVLQTLSDAIGDPKNHAVSRAAYTWYKRVQKQMKH